MTSFPEAMLSCREKGPAGRRLTQVLPGLLKIGGVKLTIRVPDDRTRTNQKTISTRGANGLGRKPSRTQSRFHARSQIRPTGS